MAIRFQCPECGQSISVGEHMAGHRGACPNCRKQVIVPSQAPARPQGDGRRSSSLSDWLTFRRMVTPKIIQALFVICVILSILGMVLMIAMSVYDLYKAPREDKLSFVLMAVAAPFLAALAIMVARIYAEVLIVVFRINETLSDVLDELKSTPRQ